MNDNRSDLLTLSMIVKDEEKTLARTLRSARSFVDRWVILDTGSSDGTRELVHREMGSVPGELVEAPFVDFSTTRNLALDHAGFATEFVIWLDADDELQNGEALRVFLERERGARDPDREAYDVRVDVGIRFDSPRVLRARAGWRFRGEVHEILSNPESRSPSHRIPDVVIHHERGEGSAERSKKRWERDVGLLEHALAKDPGDTRSAFYLAQTLRWLGRNEEAEKAFAQRIAMGGWWEEIFESKLSLGRIGEARGLPWPETEARYLDAHLAAPHRAEPLYAIALHYDRLGQHALTYLFARRGDELPLPVKDKLFVDEEVYTWKMADLLATSGYWLGELDVGEEAARRAAAARPEDARLAKNLGFYVARRTQENG